MLRARLAAVYWARPGGLAAAEGPDGDAIEDRRVEVELAGLLEQPEHVQMEAVPDPGLLTGPEPAVGRAAGAAEFLGDVLPAAAAGQDEPDHPDDDPMTNWGRPPFGPTGFSGGR